MWHRTGEGHNRYCGIIVRDRFIYHPDDYLKSLDLPHGPSRERGKNIDSRLRGRILVPETCLGPCGLQQRQPAFVYLGSAMKVLRTVFECLF